MILDRTTMFSNAQAVTATAASTDTIDLGQPGTVYGAGAALTRDIGAGNSPELLVTVTESFNNLTSLQIEIQTDDNTSFSSPKVAYLSPAYALADLVVGARYLIPDSFPVGTNERYVRLRYIVTGMAPTTGKITAGVVWGRQTNR